MPTLNSPSLLPALILLRSKPCSISALDHRTDTAVANVESQRLTSAAEAAGLPQNMCTGSNASRRHRERHNYGASALRNSRSNATVTTARSTCGKACKMRYQGTHCDRYECFLLCGL